MALARDCTVEAPCVRTRAALWGWRLLHRSITAPAKRRREEGAVECPHFERALGSAITPQATTTLMSRSCRQRPRLRAHFLRPPPSLSKRESQPRQPVRDDSADAPSRRVFLAAAALRDPLSSPECVPLVHPAVRCLTAGRSVAWGASTSSAQAAATSQSSPAPASPPPSRASDPKRRDVGVCFSSTRHPATAAVRVGWRVDGANGAVPRAPPRSQHPPQWHAAALDSGDDSSRSCLGALSDPGQTQPERIPRARAKSRGDTICRPSDADGG